MHSCELVTQVTAIACAIAGCSTTDEINILSAVFTQLGDTLATIAVQQESKSSMQDETQDETQDEC